MMAAPGEAMKRDEFQRMWNEMQKQGYFSQHPHYVDWTMDPGALKPVAPERVDLAQPPEPPFDRIDFRASDVTFPRYTEELERAIKRNEYFWLPEMFALPRGGTVVDVGCGFGRSLEWMRTIYDRCVGIDISEAAIRLATERFAGIQGVEFMVGPGDRLPAQIADQSVDFIYAFNVFEHIPVLAAAYLSDFVRALRPAGCAVFNLLRVREHAQDGPGHWIRIGCPADAATAMVRDAGLQVGQPSAGDPDTPASWLVSGVPRTADRGMLRCRPVACVKSPGKEREALWTPSWLGKLKRAGAPPLWVFLHPAGTEPLSPLQAGGLSVRHLSAGNMLVR
jgi:SAM-dependent methyltransferase